jgi:hypothetical protein
LEQGIARLLIALLALPAAQMGRDLPSEGAVYEASIGQPRTDHEVQRQSPASLGLWQVARQSMALRVCEQANKRLNQPRKGKQPLTRKVPTISIPWSFDGHSAQPTSDLATEGLQASQKVH